MPHYLFLVLTFTLKTDATIGVLPQFYISATGLDSKTGVVVVVDKADEFSLKAILVHEAENAIDGNKRRH